MECQSLQSRSDHRLISLRYVKLAVFVLAITFNGIAHGRPVGGNGGGVADQREMEGRPHQAPKGPPPATSPTQASQIDEKSLRREFLEDYIRKNIGENTAILTTLQKAAIIRLVDERIREDPTRFQSLLSQAAPLPDKPSIQMAPYEAKPLPGPDIDKALLKYVVTSVLEKVTESPKIIKFIDAAIWPSEVVGSSEEEKSLSQLRYQKELEDADKQLDEMISNHVMQMQRQRNSPPPARISPIKSSESRAREEPFMREWQRVKERWKKEGGPYRGPAM
jgi:hypothetical protein